MHLRMHRLSWRQVLRILILAVVHMSMMMTVSGISIIRRIGRQHIIYIALAVIAGNKGLMGGEYTIKHARFIKILLSFWVTVKMSNQLIKGKNKLVLGGLHLKIVMPSVMILNKKCIIMLFSMIQIMKTLFVVVKRIYLTMKQWNSN